MTKRRPRPGRFEPDRQEGLPRLWSNSWLNGLDRDRDGLISWRNYLAMVLDAVSIADVTNGLGRAIIEMECTTSKAVLDGIDYQLDQPVTFSFNDWLPHWREHFTHWTDPARAMLGKLCIAPEARLLAEQLHAMDGEVLLDFLLGPCCTGLDLRWAVGEAMPLEPGSALILELGNQQGRMIDRLRRTLYQRFTDTAPFIFLPCPEDVSLDLNFDRLCPPDADNVSNVNGRGDKP